MRITKLAIGTYKTIRNGAEHIALVVSGHVNGAEQAQAIFSIVPWAVAGTVPRLGELRALLNGSSIEGVMGMSREECLMNILPTVTESSVLLKLAETDRAEYDRVIVMRGPEYRAAVQAMIQAEMVAALPVLSEAQEEAHSAEVVRAYNAIGAHAGTVAAPGEMIYPATGPSAPAVQRAYTFDMTLAASITVTAASEEEGKRMMWDLLQCAQTNFGAWPDGSEATGEVSLQDLGDMELGLVDGDDAPLESCEVCSAQVSDIIGAPCGAEVCRACFDNGAA